MSRRDHNDLDRDVKLYFVIANVASDAFTSCWETKRFYDSSRPWTLIRHYHKGEIIQGLAGLDGGVKRCLLKSGIRIRLIHLLRHRFRGTQAGTQQ